jgi:energy-coupling factor transporter transmembrane protein EcfT
MSPREIAIAPASRVVVAIAVIAGALVSTNALAMIILWVGLILPAMQRSGILGRHLRFVGSILLPMGFLLVTVWGGIVGGAPGMVPGSSPRAGILFGCLVVIRLGLVGGVLQLAVLSIPNSEILQTLRQWGVRGEALAMAAGSLIIWPELRMRADQVLAARYARGLIPNRRLATRLAQLPHLLRPLFAWALRSAVQRSEAWRQRQLVVRLQNHAESQPIQRGVRDVALIVAAILWLLLCVAPRILSSL